MATLIELPDMTEGYLGLIDLIQTEGTRTSPRGQATIEIEDAVVVLADPRQAAPIGLGRKYSTRIMAAETMQWLSGLSDLTQLNWASKGKFSNYADDSVLYGAYGPRAASGLSRAVRLLAADQDSRQAVVSIWSTRERDATKDLPCTLSWGFRIRNGKLNMSTTMRSWDVFTGVTYDLPAMTRIQSAVAWALGVEAGTYTHFAHSLHVYERDLPACAELKVGGDDREQPPMLSDGLDEWILDRMEFPAQPKDSMERFHFLLHQATNIVRQYAWPTAPGFQWYRDALAGTAISREYCVICGYCTDPGEHPPHFMWGERRTDGSANE